MSQSLTQPVPPGSTVAYATDPGFALPTVASITTLRRFLGPEALPVHVLVVGFSSREIDEFAALIEPLGVSLSVMDPELIAAFNTAQFNKTHVPPSSLARFFLADCSELTKTRRLLYVDGDTLFLSSPASLLSLPFADDKVLMAEDQSFYYQYDRGPTGRSVRQYFQGIGIDGQKGYGNAGVILSSFAAWKQLSAEALHFLRENLALCRFHDQSAINAVIGERRARLSAAWNFQIPFRDWGAGEIVAPKLVHFAGSEKPWRGRLPSSAQYHAIYASILDTLPKGSLSRKEWPVEQAHHIHQAIRRQQLKNATIFRWRISRRRKLFAQTERSAIKTN